MITVCIAFLIEMALSWVLRLVWPDINLVGLSVFYICINSFLIFVRIYREKEENWLSMSLIGGYVFRILLLILDLYGRHILVLPSSGRDSERYYFHVQDVIKSFQSGQGSPHDMYPTIMGGIGYFFGDERLILQYTNVLFSMFTIFIVYKIMKMLHLQKKIIVLTISIMAFLPNYAIGSAIFLRESCIVVLVAISIYYFVKWHQYGKFKDIGLAIIFMAISMSLHAGVLGLLIGYFITFVIYSPKEKKIIINQRTFSVLIGAVIIGVAMFSLFGDSLLVKFRHIDSVEAVGQQVTNYSTGGSVYLSNLAPNNIVEMILYFPIRALYFLMSPMPWDIRGINDIIAFVFSGMYYGVVIYMIWKLIKLRKYDYKDKDFILCIILGFCITLFIFSFGTSNAGTAARHRDKLLPVATILIALGADRMKACEKLIKEKVTNKRTNKKL